MSTSCGGSSSPSAELGGDEARALAERLTGPLEASLRLALLSALSAAAEEITSQLAPGLGRRPAARRRPRLRRHSPAGAGAPAHEPEPGTRSARGAAEADEGATARITLRLPEQLKTRIEDAAGREGFSVNTWLVRAVSRGLEPAATSGPTDRRRKPLVRPALLRLGPVAARCPPSPSRGPIPMPTFDTPTPIQIRHRPLRRLRPGPRERPHRHRGHGPPRRRAQVRRRPGRRPDPRRVRRRPARDHLAAPRPAAVHGQHAVGRRRRSWSRRARGSRPRSPPATSTARAGSATSGSTTATATSGSTGRPRSTPARRPVTSPWRQVDGDADAGTSYGRDPDPGGRRIPAPRQRLRRHHRGARAGLGRGDHQVRPGERPPGRRRIAGPRHLLRHGRGRRPRGHPGLAGPASRRPGRSATC